MLAPSNSFAPKLDAKESRLLPAQAGVRLLIRIIHRRVAVPPSGQPILHFSLIEHRLPLSCQ